ncbi:MAG: hypothetical protein Unbinned8622contig1003_7 [Prokaryotic dsDNA virus sp.]|nr:MAG: hypothetical protein Unbinned8622contig1003_7 [Prokaryotic dsDNA virus sp.]
MRVPKKKKLKNKYNLSITGLAGNGKKTLAQQLYLRELLKIGPGDRSGEEGWKKRRKKPKFNDGDRRTA